MMDIVIKPVDVWLFRDARPFFAGEDREATTIFPPTPFTLQGAVRTKIISDKGLDFSQFNSSAPDPEVGKGDDFGKLRLEGPMLARKRKDGTWERLILMPADVLRVGNVFNLLKPKLLPFKTNLPEGLQLLWVNDKKIGETEGWLPESEWERYLHGEAPKKCACEKGSCVCNEKLFNYESHFGIAIERDKRTTQTQMLYRKNFVRLQEDVALWAKIENVKMQSKGFLRFGGEGRAAIYEEIEKLRSFASYTPKLENRFKVVTISPAWFSGGWKPKDAGWNEIFGFSANLIAAAIPRPQKIGGFDLVKKKPKSVYNFVPAGSVYFFETDERPKFDDDFSFTETPEDVRRENSGENAWGSIGFGKVLIGVW